MNQMQAVLDREIDANPNGAVAGQITLANGAVFEGAFRRDKLEGVYVARVIARDPRNGREMGQVNAYFLGADIKLFMLPVEKPLVEVATVEPVRVRLE